MLKGIFFDIGYVICRMNTGDWRATNKFYEYVSREYMEGLPPDIRDDAYQAGNVALDGWKFVRNRQEEYQMNVESYRAMIGKLPGISVSEETLQEIAYDRTFNMDNYAFFEGVPEVIRELGEKYKIGIISDTWPSADDVLKKAGVYDLVDSFTYSCYVGTAKPNPKMYETALQGIGLEGEETLFVDDCIPNLAAAAQFGIKPVLMLTKEKRGASSFVEIESLTELPGIVDGGLR